MEYEIFGQNYWFPSTPLPGIINDHSLITSRFSLGGLMENFQNKVSGKDPLKRQDPNFLIMSKFIYIVTTTAKSQMNPFHKKSFLGMSSCSRVIACSRIFRKFSEIFRKSARLLSFSKNCIT